MRKREIVAMVLGAALVLMSTGSFASGTFVADGSAIVPSVLTKFVSASNRNWTQLVLTNTTGVDVTCKVTFFDGSGNDITTSLCYVAQVVNGSSIAVSVSDGEFTLPALSTVYISTSLGTTCFYWGFATVQWRSDSTPLSKAIIGTAVYNQYNGGTYNQSRIAINNGEVF